MSYYDRTSRPTHTNECDSPEPPIARNATDSSQQDGSRTGPFHRIGLLRFADRVRSPDFWLQVGPDQIVCDFPSSCRTNTQQS